MLPVSTTRAIETQQLGCHCGRRVTRDREIDLARLRSEARARHQFTPRPQPAFGRRQPLVQHTESHLFGNNGRVADV